MIHNVEIASVFEEVADLLEIQGANPFRVRAYRNAARVISQWPKELSAVLAEQKALPKIPGVGKDLDLKIREIITTKKLALLVELRTQVPGRLVDLLRVPFLGPKRVKILEEKLGIRSLQALEKAARLGKIQELSGFGQKTESKILEELSRMGTPGAPFRGQIRFELQWAEKVVAPLLNDLKARPGVRHAIVAGSFRRRLDTVGDLDLLVTFKKGSPDTLADDLMDRFIHFEEVIEVISQGHTRSTVLLRSGIQVDLRVVPEESYGAALYYFTGSKAHNIAIRTLGIERGLKINEYGIFRGRRRIGGKTEQEVLDAVGLPYIEPELRENRGEIQAARVGELPDLITLEDIRGDLHAHTYATDGSLSIREMAEAARRMGYEYLAITDHTQHLKVARGLDRSRLLMQTREIDRLNEEMKDFRILKSSEVDILEDGSLDLPDDVLEKLDLRVCSIHSHFHLSEARQTERVIRAMDHPLFNIFAHPTGRLIGRRRPYEMDLEKVMKAAFERGCALEINAQSARMDLSEVHCQMAREIGVKLAISTDAHSDRDLASMRFGVSQARRGWLEAKNVVNTLPVEELLKLMQRRRGGISFAA